MFTLLLGTTLLTACKKEGCTDPTAINYNLEATKDDGSCQLAATVENGFVWKEDGGSEITADSAFWTTWSNGTGIRAYKNGMNNFFEVNWDTQDNTAIGSKSISVSGGFTFLKGSETYTNSGGGTVNITDFSNNKLSGNFSITTTGGSIQTVSATFSNLPKK